MVKTTRRTFFQAVLLGVSIMIIMVLYEVIPIVQFAPIKRKLENIRNESNRKVILLEWDSFFGDYHENAMKECPEIPCLLTRDRRYMEFADALIFHPIDTNLRNLPSKRHPSQSYVFHYMESPVTNTVANVFDALPEYFFNWTMTYRRESDIYRPYGTFNSLASVALSYTPLANVELVSVEVDKIGVRDANFKNKLIISLFKEACNNRINDEYLFYLAFENSCATDYATEKFWGRLQANVIPVVPPEAFLSLDDYSSIKQLALHMIKISQNQTEILKFIKWKRIWWQKAEMKKKEYLGFCRLCERLLIERNSSSRFRVYKTRDLQKWFIDGDCQNNNSVSNMLL